MSDLTDPTAALDEVASAVVDGVATQAELARVETDHTLAARVEALRMARRALARPVAIDATRRDAHLAAALAAFDGTSVDARGGDDVGPAASAPILSLDEARRRRHRRLVPVISVAAASVLLLGVGALALRGGDDAGTSTGRDADTTAALNAAPPVAKQASEPGFDAATTTAASAVTAAPTTTAGASPEVAAGSSGGGDMSTMDRVVSAPAPFGVEVDSPVDLPAVVAGMLNAQGTVSATDSTARCPGQTGDEVGDITWRGVPAIVFVQPDVATRDQAVVVDASSCAVLATADLPAA